MFLILFFTLNAKIFINVGEPKFVKPNFALINKCNVEYCSEVFKVIESDLTFSNIFSFVPIKNYSKDYDNISSWTASGTKYLLKINYKKPNFEIILFDIETALKIIDYKEKELATYALTAHKISSKIYEELTSKKAIFNTKIAFIGLIKAYKNLFIMDYDGRNIEQLTNFKTILVTPSWSPDGTLISYSRYRTFLQNKRILTSLDLFLFNIKTRTETLIVNGGQNSSASWSKDGKFIVFTSSRGGDPDLYAYSLEAKKIIPLVKQRGIDVEASYSADGSKLVYSSSISGNPELYIFDLEKQSSKRITFSRHYNSSPSWSPISDSIVFAGLDNPFNKAKSFFDIFLLSIDGKEIERLTINAGNNENPSWSPDSRHLVFTSTRNAGSDIYFINEDGTNQRRLTNGIQCYSPNWSNFFN